MFDDCSAACGGFSHLESAEVGGKWFTRLGNNYII